jgi:integrase
MTLREAIEQYILWRRAHGAKFTTGANLLRHFLGYADGDAPCDAVTTTQVLAFLAGKEPLARHRENKYYALAGFWRHAISRGHATRRGAVQLDAVTFRTLLLLLYGAGLRFSEATRLTLADVYLTEDVLTIRATKFYKSRLVPIARFGSAMVARRCIALLLG